MDGVLRHAGLRDRVVIERGLAKDVITGLRAKYGPADLIFEVDRKVQHGHHRSVSTLIYNQQNMPFVSHAVHTCIDPTLPVS